MVSNENRAVIYPDEWNDLAETITTVSESDTFVAFEFDATTGVCCSMDIYEPCDLDDETALAQVEALVEQEEDYAGDYFQYEILDSGWVHYHYDVDFSAALVT